MKRFDDVDQRVRLRAAQVLSAMFSNMPKSYDPDVNSARLLDLLGDAVIFLDDPDTKLQEAVVGKKRYASLLYSIIIQMLGPSDTIVLMCKTKYLYHSSSIQNLNIITH